MITPVFYRGVPGVSFRGDQPARVLRIVWLAPPGGPAPRLCLHLQFMDGIEDFAPLEEAIERKLLSAEAPK